MRGKFGGLLALGVVLLTACALRGTAAQSGDESDWTVVGTDRMSLSVLEGDVPRYELEFRVISKGWMARPRLNQMPSVEAGDVRVYEQEGIAFYEGWANQPTGGTIDLRQEVRKVGPDTIRLEYTSQPEVDTQYSFPNRGVGIGPVIGMSPYFNGGTCTVHFADGSTETLPYPTPPMWGKGNIKQIVLRTADGEVTRLSFEPDVFLHSDNSEVRLFADPDEETPAGGTMTQIINIELPGRTAFEPRNRWIDTSDWLTYEHDEDFSPGSVIGVEDWLEKPAGSHGWLQMDGDEFVFEDGTPVKFFATNISWDDMAAPREESDQWNDKWAKHGVNLVRLHKFINHGWAGILTPEDHMVPAPEKIKLFDYYHASARKRGIYTSWSAVFHMKLTPADEERVRYYDEVMAADRQGDVLGLINIAPDIQELLIKQTLNLLTRENTATGIRYADDPALAYIELRNEDDIFMMRPDSFRKRWPQYWADFTERFCAYLKEKYGSQQALEQAWGNSYPRGKSLAAADIEPAYDAWQINQGNVTPRMSDSMHFMYTEQLGFYRRFKQAIRDAGYEGAICGSCWQASCWLGHLYNTLSDREVGFIDRHNYSSTPLDRPGAGNMSVGFQQVMDRPFNFSEWGGGSVAVPTVAVYGLGLQGWDASCQFSSKIPGIYNERQKGVNGCCEDLIQIGQYPALSRMVYRGDVEEGDVVANRRISIPGLFKGDVGFYEHFTLLGGGANTKEFSSVVPQSALMAGRVVLEYIDQPVPEKPVVQNVARYLDEENGTVRSTTGQLLWDHSGRGFYTVDTPGTQAVIGYAGGRTIDLGDVTFRGVTDTELKLYVTALEEDATIEDADRLLVTAFGRDANTGMVFDEFSDRPLEGGDEPLLLEPVKATITIKGCNVRSVRPLDHGGRLREDARPLKVQNGRFTIDGKGSQTMYYLVEME